MIATDVVERTDLKADGIEVAFRPKFGMLAELRVTDGAREITPLHCAPWVGTDETMPRDAAPHLAALQGDFFCAPFGAAEGSSGLHGWTANADWEVEVADGASLRARLHRSISGARVFKEITLRDGHLFAYQRHVFEAGAGDVPVANHANVSVSEGVLISTSPKAIWATPGAPLEDDPKRGRSALCYPAEATDPQAFPAVDGPVDLTRWPWGEAHEDFVIGIEAANSPLGWTAVVRPDLGWAFLSLRDPFVLPMTMLWHSNGGRDYAPWSGRHRGCLGVEEGAAAHLLPSSTQAHLAGPGALKLGGRSEVRHVIGAFAWEAGRIRSVVVSKGAVEVTGETGGRRLRFDDAFVAGDLP